MERLRVRFEQRRGHYLVVEGNPALSRDDFDAFQLRMLQRCEVPGLLRLETEEIDGALSLRFSLTGTRMLSQALRAQKWTMTEFMTALCRLAEVLEDCRLYVLSERKIVLDDDWIFAGEGWNDLRFVCLPVRDDSIPSSRELDALVVRWIMHVTDPDGRTVQQLLRLVASPDFKPADLRGFARQYLAEKIGRGAGAAKAAHPEMEAGMKAQGLQAAASGLRTLASSPPVPAPKSVLQPPSSGTPGLSQSASLAAPGYGSQKAPPGSGTSQAVSANWRWFQPPPGEAQALSGLLGMELGLGPAAETEEEPIQAAGHEDGRYIVWIACAVVAITAVSWRWGYAAHPDQAGLVLSSGITLAAVAGAVYALIMLRRKKQAAGGKSRQQTEMEGPRPEEFDRPFEASVDASGIPPIPLHLPSGGSPKSEADEWLTGMLMQAEDRTQLLTGDGGKPSAAGYYLHWESRKDFPPLELNASSFIIGRSREASAHVDETAGVSRAHVELLRDGQGWTAKDLGSRNGTKLNGVPMVPYEAYPLKPDDCLDLAGSRYRLKLGGLSAEI